MPKRQIASTGEIVDIDKAHMTAEQLANSSKPTMSVKVYAPFKVYFEGEAYSITAVNETGPFDVLPHHHNFLCMLVPCDLVITTPKRLRRLRLLVLSCT